MTTTLVKFSNAGTPDSLYYETAELPPPAAHEVRIKQSAIAVNFVDIYVRKGLYRSPELPGALGMEAMGTVIASGRDVHRFSIGERVIYAGLPLGSYASERNVAAYNLIKLPDTLPDIKVAGSFLRGLTACMLLTYVHRVENGQKILIHAAAGGLGQILVRWAKSLGACVIGTVGSKDKARRALNQGADHTILYRQNDFETVVAGLTEGRGVDYAIDGIGGTTLTKTIRTTKNFATTASIGQIAGACSPIDTELLSNRFLIRPSILTLLADKQHYRYLADCWFAFLAHHDFPPARTYALTESVKAHTDLETGQTSGAVVLRP